MSVYKQNGFKNRMDYLKYLSEVYSMGIFDVIAIADTLGPSEDFDGLVTTIEDSHFSYWDI